MLQQFRSYVLPVAMLLGFLFHDFWEQCNPIVPYLLFSMLLITFCSINIKNMRFTKLNFWLLLIQVGASIIVFEMVKWMDIVLAEGAMMCVLAPTANSTVVIGGLLGGNKTTIITHTLLCNIIVAFEAPIFFSLIGTSDISFWQSCYEIMYKMIPLIIFPLILAIVLQFLTPKLYSEIKKWQNLSFYLWAMALTIVMGRTVNFILIQENSNYYNEILLAILSIIICAIQFPVGRWVGKRYNDAVAGGQLLGQKNVALAVWMTQTYLNPIASIAPASYSIWQNLFNSYQLWRKRKKDLEIQ